MNTFPQIPLEAVTLYRRAVAFSGRYSDLQTSRDYLADAMAFRKKTEDFKENYDGFLEKLDENCLNRLLHPNYSTLFEILNSILQGTEALQFGFKTAGINPEEHEQQLRGKKIIPPPFRDNRIALCFWVFSSYSYDNARNPG